MYELTYDTYPLPHKENHDRVLRRKDRRNDNGLVLVGGSRPSAYVGIVDLRVWTPTGELSMSIPRGSRPSNRVGIVETYNYNHEIVLLA